MRARPPLSPRRRTWRSWTAGWPGVKLRTRSGIGVGVPFGKVRQKYPHGTAGGRPSFQWYYLGAAPIKTGDLYTLVSDASGKMAGEVRDFDIGRFDSADHHAFFSDVPECAWRRCPRRAASIECVYQGGALAPLKPHDASQSREGRPVR